MNPKASTEFKKRNSGKVVYKNKIKVFNKGMRKNMYTPNDDII